MATEAGSQVSTNMPAVFCGPQADAAFFVALALAVFGLYGIYRLLTSRVNRTTLELDESTTSE